MSMTRSTNGPTNEPAAKPAVTDPVRPRFPPSNAANRPGPRPSVPWNPLWTFLALLLVLLGVASLTGEGPQEGTDYLSVAESLGLAAACLWTTCRLVFGDPLYLWTPLPWFLSACALYYGVGPLIYAFGSPMAVAQMDTLWAVSAADLRRTFVLNVVGILTVTATFLLVAGRSSGAGAALASPVLSQRGASAARVACLMFFAIGLPVKYLLVLPHQFGLLGYTPPTAVTMLVDMDLLGILMLSYLAARDGKIWTIALVAVLALELTVELIRFNKHMLLLALITVVLGRYLVKKRLGELVVAGGGFVVIYLLLSPFVSRGRLEISRRHGNHYEAPLGERFEIARLLLTSPGSVEAEATVSDQGWWGRLCYTPAQAFAMHNYDAGAPGDSFDMLAYVLVPRLIDPDKPIMTDAGYDFTELAHGHRHSLTGIGIFGEAYWNGGWPMVGVASACIGLLFAGCSLLARKAMSGPYWPFFIPCVFFGMRGGYRIDGWFVGDYAGQVPMFLALFALCCLMALLFRSVVNDGGAPRGRADLA